MTPEQASMFVMMEVRTRFQWPLSPVQASDWVRCVSLCRDVSQAKKIILEMVDEGKLSADKGVAVFRSKWQAIAPPPEPPHPVDYTQFEGAAVKLRERVIASGDARLKVVLDNVDQVRASKPMAWRPLSEDEQQRRKATIIAQLHATQAIEAGPSSHDQGQDGVMEGAEDRSDPVEAHTQSGPVFDPPNPLDEDLPF